MRPAVTYRRGNEQVTYHRNTHQQAQPLIFRSEMDSDKFPTRKPSSSSTIIVGTPPSNLLQPSNTNNIQQAHIVNGSTTLVPTNKVEKYPVRYNRSSRTSSPAGVHIHQQRLQGNYSDENQSIHRSAAWNSVASSRSGGITAAAETPDHSRSGSAGGSSHDAAAVFYARAAASSSRSQSEMSTNSGSSAAVQAYNNRARLSTPLNHRQPEAPLTSPAIEVSLQLHGVKRSGSPKSTSSVPGDLVESRMTTPRSSEISSSLRKIHESIDMVPSLQGAERPPDAPAESNVPQDPRQNINRMVAAQKAQLLAQEEEIKQLKQALVDRSNEVVEMMNLVQSNKTQMEQQQRDLLDKDKSIAALNEELRQLRHHSQEQKQVRNNSLSNEERQQMIMMEEAQMRLQKTVQQMTAVIEGKAADFEALKGERDQLRSEKERIAKQNMIFRGQKEEDKEMIARLTQREARLTDELRDQQRQFAAIQQEMERMDKKQDRHEGSASATSKSTARREDEQNQSTSAKMEGGVVYAHAPLVRQVVHDIDGIKMMPDSSAPAAARVAPALSQHPANPSQTEDTAEEDAGTKTDVESEISLVSLGNKAKALEQLSLEIDGVPLPPLPPPSPVRVPNIATTGAPAVEELSEVESSALKALKALEELTGLPTA